MTTSSYAPIVHDIDEVFCSLEVDGSLEISARLQHQRQTQQMCITLTPRQVVAVRAFFAMPRVAPTIDAAAAERYATIEAAYDAEREHAQPPTGEIPQ